MDGSDPPPWADGEVKSFKGLKAENPAANGAKGIYHLRRTIKSKAIAKIPPPTIKNCC